MHYGRVTRNVGTVATAWIAEGASGTCVPSEGGLRKRSPERYPVTGKLLFPLTHGDAPRL